MFNRLIDPLTDRLIGKKKLLFFPVFCVMIFIVPVTFLTFNNTIQQYRETTNFIIHQKKSLARLASNGVQEKIDTLVNIGISLAPNPIMVRHMFLILLTALLTWFVLHIIIVNKRATKARLESEYKHKTMIANIGDVIGIIGSDGIIKYKSPNIERWFGWKPEDLVGTDAWNTVHSEDIERIQKEFYTLLEKDNALATVEYRYKCKNDTYKWIELTAVNCINDSAINGVLANYRDITQRKKAEREIIQQRQKAERYLNLAGVMFIGLDISGNINIGNRQACKVLESDEADIIGQNWFDNFIPLNHRNNVRSVFNQLINGEIESVEYYENTIISKNGTEKIIAWHNTYITGDDGKIIGVLCSGEDITDKRELEAQLRQTQKMESIGVLAGGIAHDFNNILFPIVGHTEMLLEDVPEDGPFRDSLNAIYTSSLRARDLVQQILTFSRQEKNELKLMKMQPIVKEAMKMIRSTIPTTINIAYEIDNHCGHIKADPTQIHQIVMNLATNAYHAMEETGGELRVGIKDIELGECDVINPEMTPGLYACLTISDTGVGMDKELTEKIFDPFFSTKEKGKGTGMGLSVVHGVVKSMNGAIHVYSEPGKGTKFCVYFPLEKKLSKENTTRSDTQIQNGNEQILLVDDEELLIAREKQIL